MSKSSHQTRYARLVSAFAASAFALLVMVSLQLQAANTATATAVSHPLTLTNYRQLPACSTQSTDPTHRLLNKACLYLKKAR